VEKALPRFPSTRFFLADPSPAMLDQARDEAEAHVERFDSEFFPLTVTEHLELLREAGFRTAELFWYSYMQAGVFAIR
jgi:hypothetical protein